LTVAAYLTGKWSFAYRSDSGVSVALRTAAPRSLSVASGFAQEIQAGRAKDD